MEMSVRIKERFHTEPVGDFVETLHAVMVILYEQKLSSFKQMHNFQILEIS
jgi:hypothetical protein